jgi:hypothetical protein
LYDEWLAKVRKSSSWAATAGQWFERASAWFSARWSDTSKIVAKAVVREDGRETAVSGYDSALVAQFIDGSRVDDVVTLITAPNSSYLGEVAGCLVDPRVWMKIAGRMSSIDASNGQVAVTPAGAPRLISTQPFSIGNTRLIVAGWLSLNTATYVVVAFALALLLALTTTLFVRNVGRRQQ